MASRGTRTIIASTSRGLISRRQASTSAGPSSSSTTANDSDVLPLPAPPKPPLKSWFTGRPSLTSFISELSSTLQETRSTLFRSGYLTSVSQDIRTIPRAFAKDATAASSSAKWKGSDDLASELRVAKVRLAYYRRITSLLAELHALQPMLRIEPTLAAHHTRVAELLRRCRKTDAQELTAAAALVDSQQEIFEPPMTQAETERQKARLGGLAANDPAALALIQKERRKRSYGYHDVGLTGIAYGGGRKKTASAQAWLVPVAHSVTPEEESSSSDRIGKVLVNALPISTYFPTAAERSVLLRPFSLTETTGRYNVFVLVQGGGMSSKATAASVACARALAAITDEQTGQEINRAILSKADLLRRDPRVVERKKTGQPKARKRFTWVKR